MALTSGVLRRQDNALLPCPRNTVCLSCHISGPLASRWADAQILPGWLPPRTHRVFLGLHQFTLPTSASIPTNRPEPDVQFVLEMSTVHNVSLHEVMENTRVL